MWILIVCGPFLWVYLSAWARAGVERAGFWDYHWLALICGIISTIAIIVSAAVNDALIEKVSAGFLVFFIVQCLSVPWYVIYFILSWYYRS
jgi:hypothetical protein